jgi:hypothetical protein
MPILPDIRGEAARLAEALPLGELHKGFAEVPFARLEGCVGLSAVDRDTRDLREPVDKFFFLDGWRHSTGPIDRHDAIDPS